MTEPLKAQTVAVEPVSVPLVRAHELVGCSRTQFAKMYVETGLVEPVDLGGRGKGVIVAEVKSAVLKRVAGIRSGEIVPLVRNSRGKRPASA